MGRLAIDLTGKKFGMLTVIARCGSSRHGSALWECSCECGEKCIVFASNLQRGWTKSCGCIRKPDLVGQKFGKLLVLRKEGSNKQNSYTWLCECDCGKTCIVSTGGLKSKNTQSCGCLLSEVAAKKATKHGQAGGRNKTKTSEYAAWRSMKGRCLDLKNIRYKHYGGRGIKVCDQWLHSFEQFYEDVGPKPGKKYSLDRKDNDGNYEPDNCRWATKEEQANNTQRSKKNK